MMARHFAEIARAAGSDFERARASPRASFDGAAAAAADGADATAHAATARA